MREGGVRLAELVASLSLGVDLGFGQPMEHVLRQCLIALRIAESLGLDDTEERAALYYAALLVNVGCHSDAHEQAWWFGDDIALKATKYTHEPFSVGDIVATVRLLGSGGTPLHRVRTGFEFALGGHRDIDDMVAGHARLARALGERLHLSPTAVANVGSSYELWNGKGWPGKVAGEDIPLGARIIMLADFVEVAHRTGGVEAARALATRRAGKHFDPLIAATFCLDAEKILHGLDEVSSWSEVIDAEPALGIVLDADATDAALTAIADFVDLKSPYLLGHSGAVAALATDAGRRLGITDDAELRVLRRGGLTHDFGRLGVSNGIWDKKGPLRAGEWERVRMAPYFAERMLRQSDALAPLAAIAVQHREHLDGTGYPRALTGPAISRAARVVGAACAYQAMREPRPHRPARPADEAASQLRAEVRAGRLDGDVVEAVLAAAGHRVQRRREGPAGLTGREIEVLQLVARGLSNKAIAARLVISAKTAANHVEHIYAKIGVTNRAAASLFAVQHGLLPED